LSVIIFGFILSYFFYRLADLTGTLFGRQIAPHVAGFLDIRAVSPQPTDSRFVSLLVITIFGSGSLLLGRSSLFRLLRGMLIGWLLLLSVYFIATLLRQKLFWGEIFIWCYIFSLLLIYIRLKEEVASWNRSNKEIFFKEQGLKYQDQFLEQFYEEISKLNDAVFLRLEDMKETLESMSEVNSQIFIKMMTSCEELRDYLYGIRQLASISWHQKRIEPKNWFNIDMMLRRVLQQFDSKCIDKKIAITAVCNPYLEIFAEVNIVENIIHNFVSNAVKYCPDGSTIKIVVNPRRFRATEIHVIDNGPGIPHEHHASIFEKFFRINHDDLNTKGMGLGLFLCDFFARKIGARLFLKSEPGKGAVFTFKVFSPRRILS
jgi:signal transduction histidine kinase